MTHVSGNDILLPLSRSTATCNCTQFRQNETVLCSTFGHGCGCVYGRRNPRRVDARQAGVIVLAIGGHVRVASIAPAFVAESATGWFTNERPLDVTLVNFEG